MSKVQEHYEAYPYPERNPQDEKKRMISGSPSHPLEIDHFVFKGKRNWRQPIKILVAGGGTGDALIQMAQTLTSGGKPYEITYVDLSTASRQIAEERAKIRGLTGIEFITGSLLDAPKLGAFDYIDCCGVLHHLPEPQAGFDALSAALKPGGGLGFMVYAKYGRTGVYPLQDAFNALFGDMTPGEKLNHAKRVFKALPPEHPFRLNPNLVDHKKGDAGFYDLLLHSQDRPYTVLEIGEALENANMELVQFAQPALYDLATLLPDGIEPPENMDRLAHMAAAERLRGTIRTHVAYAKLKGDDACGMPDIQDMTVVPHIKGAPGRALAGEVAKRGKLTIDLERGKRALPLPKSAATLIAEVDGKTTLGEIAGRTGLDQFLFNAQWKQIDAQLAPWGVMFYSGINR